MKFLIVIILMVNVISNFCVLAGRYTQHHRDFRDRFGPIVSAASQHVSQVVGYRYPVPETSSTNLNPQIQAVPKPIEVITKELTTTKNTPTTTITPSTAKPKAKIQQVPATLIVSKPGAPVIAQASSSSGITSATTNQEKVLEEPNSAPIREENAGRQLHVHHSPQIQTIDVACGKEKMTVRVTFDQEFSGIIYAKGHYSDPNCRFTAPNQGLKVYQFEMSVGNCGVDFIDAGLKEGGQAYVEGMLVIILEPGVQEAWDSSRRIRCLWEGNIDQTVTFPLSINMLDSQTLTFSGDTAQTSLEIQTGRGPRAPSVQGLVRVGELLTAVVKVQGDAEFDVLVRNCLATDGTPENRIILSDNRGCATRNKLMSGWQKQRNAGGIAAYAYLSAFKFPDVVDLFFECTVSLCKGACEECPEYLELHVPSHDHDHEEEGVTPTPSASQTKIDVKTTGRITKRSAEDRFRDRYNETISPESLRLRRVVHVVGPDDLPELGVQGASVNGSSCANDCFSAVGILMALLLLMLICLALFAVLRRQIRDEKC